MGDDANEVIASQEFSEQSESDISKAFKLILVVFLT